MPLTIKCWGLLLWPGSLNHQRWQLRLAKYYQAKWKPEKRIVVVIWTWVDLLMTLRQIKILFQHQKKKRYNIPAKIFDLLNISHDLKFLIHILFQSDCRSEVSSSNKRNAILSIFVWLNLAKEKLLLVCTLSFIYFLIWK